MEKDVRVKFYNELGAVVESIVDDSKEPIFKHIDLWKGQQSVLQVGSFSGFPAVFLEFSPIEWKSTNSGHQIADMVFKLRICSELGLCSRYGSESKDSALKAFDYVAVIQQKLQHLKGDFFGNICRIGSQMDYGINEVGVSVESFRVRVVDAVGAAVANEQLNGFRPNISFN